VGRRRLKSCFEKLEVWPAVGEPCENLGTFSGEARNY